MEKRKENLKKGKILLVICLVVTLLFTDVKNYIKANTIESNDVAINDNTNHENNEIKNEEQTDETEEIEEYIPYLEELPKFDNDFDKALFLYGMFYDNGNLMPYSDQNNADEWHLVKLNGIKTIEDLKELAYELIDEKVVDKIVAKSQGEETPLFKETKEGIYINSGWASQYGPTLGYNNKYKKIVNKDGSITYKVTIKDTISSGPTFDLRCNTTYEYKMTKNKNGKLVFTNFEYPTNICLKDIDNKYD